VALLNKIEIIGPGKATMKSPKKNQCSFWACSSLVNVKHVVTKWLLEVLNVSPATLEIKPRVNQKNLVFRSAFGFTISGAPYFRNPYLTKVPVSSVLLYADRDTLSISLELLKLQFPFFHHHFKCLNLEFC
jgi:hypothetical protein